MLSKSTIKFIHSLQQKKNRDQEKMFIAEGPKLVVELLQEKRFNCHKVFVTPAGHEVLLADLGNSQNLPLEIIEDFELEKISSLKRPNKMLAVFNQSAKIENPDFSNKITLVLDDIQDPGNLGTLIRIADWFNIKYIICSEHTADVYNNKVVQSSMASIGRVELLYENLLTWLPKMKLPKIAASLQGISITDFPTCKEGFLLIGNEGNGLSEEVLALCDQQISIPRLGKAESLNAAVATGIILQQLVQR